jgi:hypothetical protein
MSPDGLPSPRAALLLGTPTACGTSYQGHHLDRLAPGLDSSRRLTIAHRRQPTKLVASLLPVIQDSQHVEATSLTHASTPAYLHGHGVNECSERQGGPSPGGCERGPASCLP